MKLVSRAEWGARPYRTPGGATLYSRARRGVKMHYLGSAYEDRPHTACAAYVRKLQDSHMDGNGWSDIGYSFVVCTHGYVYEGRGLKRRNSANGNTSLNEQDYAVCFLVGSSGLTKPTDDQLHGGRDAIDYCRKEGPAGTWLGGHRDGYATACPGEPLYAWVQKGAPRPASTPTTPPAQEAPDMALTKEQDEKLTYLHWKIQRLYDNLGLLAWRRKADDGREMSQIVGDIDARVQALETTGLTDAQMDRIAELVADKLAARLAE